MFDRKRPLVALTTIVATLSICAVLEADVAKPTTPVTAVVAEAGGERQEVAAKAKTQEQLVAELKRANPEFDGQLNVKLNKEGGIIDIKFEEKGDVADLTPLKGLPLEGLKLPACKKIVDLSPLSGMPLKRLYMAGTGVKSNFSNFSTSRPEQLPMFTTVGASFSAGIAITHSFVASNAAKL